MIMGLTAAGQELKAKLEAFGESSAFSITRIVAGAGFSGNPLVLTGVVSPKQEFQITQREQRESSAILHTKITNEGLEEGYPLWQIGIYAKEPETPEILYRVIQFDSPRPVPSQSEAAFEYRPVIYITAVNSEHVTVVINPDWVDEAAAQALDRANEAYDLAQEALDKANEGGGSGTIGDTIDAENVNTSADRRFTSDEEMGNIIRYKFAQFTLACSGSATWDGTYLKWTVFYSSPFPGPSNNDFLIQITMPEQGYVIQGLGAASPITVSASGIELPDGSAVIGRYIPAFTGDNQTNNGRVDLYTLAYLALPSNEIQYNDILIAARMNNVVKLGTGDTINTTCAIVGGVPRHNNVKDIIIQSTEPLTVANGVIVGVYS